MAVYRAGVTVGWMFLVKRGGNPTVSRASARLALFHHVGEDIVICDIARVCLTVQVRELVRSL